MNTIFEQIGGTYMQKSDYLVPNVGLADVPIRPVGKYGRMRRKYLKEQRPVLYNQLILSEKLFPHLQEIDLTCQERMEWMIRQMAQSEGVTERLKAEDQMEWVRRMNSIRNRAEEMILQELIYGE